MKGSGNSSGGSRGLRLVALNVYPVKSAAGISVDAWPVDEFGLAHDRRWAAVRADGRVCLTQRDLPRLALLRPVMGPGGLEALEMPGHGTLAVPPADSLGRREGERTDAVVWGDRVPAHMAGAECHAWLSDALGADCRLVHMPASARRPLRAGDLHPAPAGGRASFVDAFPILLATESSLADLNGRLAEPVPMARFRPNLVVAGAAAAFEEDRWRRVRVGALEALVVKRCGRCIVTTTDQATGRRNGPEPLRTLAGYRTIDHGARFGVYLAHLGPGRLAVDDGIEIVERA